MIKDSAQRRREANSGYRLEAMGSLSQNRGQLDAEYEFQSPGSFLNWSGRYENSGYQFEPLSSYPDRRHEGNFGSQFPPMSSFPSPNRRDENSDYRFEPLAFSAQYKRNREKYCISTGTYSLHKTTRLFEDSSRRELS